MAYPDDTTITIKVRHTTGAPSTADIIEGELAVSTFDRKIWTRDASNNIIELSGGNDHVHRPTVSTQASTSYTIDEDDENSLIMFTNSSAVTVTIPKNSVAALPVGYICHLHQKGTGTVTVAPVDTDVTINKARSLSAAVRYSALSIMKVGGDEWNVVGDQA